MVAVYVLNIAAERRPFFRRLGPFLNDQKWLVLVGDWNVTFDSYLDRGGWGANGSDRYESSLIDLLAVHDLVDRFCLDHAEREIWTWLNNSPSAQIKSYWDRVLEETILNSFLVPFSPG